jgi:hypothetical protein
VAEVVARWSTTVLRLSPAFPSSLADAGGAVVEAEAADSAAAYSKGLCWSRARLWFG